MTRPAPLHPIFRAAFSLAAVLVLLGSLVATPAAAAPEGQLTWAVHVSIAPTWFDPAETPGIITPYMFLYALHDAMANPSRPRT
jgi:peptide/nickel transport system substrate-binding protein